MNTGKADVTRMSGMTIWTSCQSRPIINLKAKLVSLRKELGSQLVTVVYGKLKTLYESEFSREPNSGGENTESLKR